MKFTLKNDLKMFNWYTVNESSDVEIDLSGKVIEIYVKTLVARNIAQVDVVEKRSLMKRGHFSGPLKSDSVSAFLQRPL